MPTKEKILKEIDAFINLWEEEVKQAEITRNKACASLLESSNHLLSGKPEDARRFDVCIILFDKALAILLEDRDRLKKGRYYADCIRGSVKALAEIEDEETPEELATTISLSAECESGFNDLMQILKPSDAENRRTISRIIIEY